ncbi:MAG: cell division protein FtsX [Flavobacteriales bacterium]
MSKSLFKTTGSSISSFSTVVGITLVLILVGVLIMVGLLGISVTNHYRSQVVLQIMLRDEASASDVQDLTSKVQTGGYAAEVVFTTKEQAARMMEEELGEEFVGFLGYNPLPASIDLKLNPDFNQSEQLDGLVKQLQAHPATLEVVYQKDLLEQMNRNLSKWSIALVLIGALLMVIALVLIVNTIQLAIFSQRFLIKSMQLVGATRWFIQKPFLRRGLWFGLVSGIFALFVIFLSLYYFREEAADFIEVLLADNGLLYLILGVLGVGLILSWLATAYAVNRYLRTEAAKLY